MIESRMEAQPIPKPMGRPRAFNEEEALDAAMDVFWRKGYEGASLSDLTEAMGINRPSLYAAFGDKEGLFRRVLDRYEQGPAAYARQAMQEPTARAAVERLLRGAVEMSADPLHPRGCLMVQGALACSEGANPVRDELNERREAGERAIRERLQRAQQEGEFAPHVNPGELARYVVTVLHGMAVQAASGATREELQGVIQTAMQAWPQ